MKAEIANNEDEFFKLGEPQKIEEVKQEEVVPEVVDVPSTAKQKIPAPLENPKGLSWFDGTSWGTK